MACCARVGDNLALLARVHPLRQQLGLLRVADAVSVRFFWHVFPLEVPKGLIVGIAVQSLLIFSIQDGLSFSDDATWLSGRERSTVLTLFAVYIFPGHALLYVAQIFLIVNPVDAAGNLFHKTSRTGTIYFSQNEGTPDKRLLGFVILVLWDHTLGSVLFGFDKRQS